MSDTNCPNCGAELLLGSLGGPCPRCALELALDATEGGDSVRKPGEADRTGQRIDRYVLLQKIGEGGMGEVWLAEQREPVWRRVAIKIVKRGMDTDRFVARFEGERQALALMDHPNVAKMLDAGATADGRPYFVMEHVQGLPVTEYCDRERLTTRERLGLFRQICDGVHHAHQKAIIHRDLKPSNVLVTVQEDRAVPKIIDFGVAKAVEQRLTEKTLFTELGMLIGTPEYMSPEQASGLGDRVDIRTDVYSLGVLLYELLAGCLPFDPQELRAEGYEGIRRVIREKEPVRPSTRIVTLGEAASGSAEHRRTDPGSLSRQLRGDLDWIVMKALDKDPIRRYPSCAQFASDIERYMADEPVTAGPPSAAYRLRKFVHRNRAAVVAAGLFLVLLVAGLVATTSLWTLADRRYDEVLRLADLKRVRDYRQQADELWPASPDNADALRVWLRERGEPLAAQLPRHEATLAALRAQAHPYGAREQERDRETHPQARALAEMRIYVEDTTELLDRIRGREPSADRDELVEHYEGRLRQARERIVELERLVAERRTWEFDDEETRWQHEMLTDLIVELKGFTDPDPFVGSVASVRARLEFARGIAERSVSGPDVAAAWEQAIAAIRTSPRYGGLELTPQIGLVPLGENAQSGLWEFWHVGSGERPPAAAADGPSRWRVDAGGGLVLVLIPGGSFWMGAQKDDPGARNYDPLATFRERGVHEIELEPFFLSKYEVTQAQWKRLTGQEPSRHGDGHVVGDVECTVVHPVESVTWEEADLTLRRHGLTLPTEAQWEYAARAGSATPWWTGGTRESLRGTANLQDLTLRRSGGRAEWTYEEWLDDGYPVHAPVGSYRANPFGLHDVIGNVAEWCREYYQTPYGKRINPGDGFRLVPGGTSSHVYRGGSFRTTAADARSAHRENGPLNRADSKIGVRPSRAIDR